MPSVPWRKTATVDPGTEYLLMASLLPLRSIVTVPWFLGLTGSVIRQLERTEGLIGYSLRAQLFARTFWTLSAWTDATTLIAFVREMPHLRAMAKMRPHMGATRFATWTALGSALPVPWDIAIGHLDSPYAGSRSTPLLTPRSITHRPTDPSKEQLS